MKIVFFGSSEFSLTPLGVIHRSPHELLGVVTVPPAAKGRGQKVQSSPVEAWAGEAKLKCWTPARLKDAAFLSDMKTLAPDLFVVASFGKILPKSLLEIPHFFGLNIHPSVLPKYRGAAPVARQIICGETKTGVTLFRMDEGMDSGDIVAQRTFPLGEAETGETLLKRLSDESAKLLLETLPLIAEKRVNFQPQDAKTATLAPKLSKQDGMVDWKKSAREIHNLIRGLKPWPLAETSFRGERILLHESRYLQSDVKPHAPGTILETRKDEALTVATGEGALLIYKLQKPGKPIITGKSFANGARLATGECFANTVIQA